MRKISLFIIMLFFLSAVNISNAQEELALQKQTVEENVQMDEASPGYQKAHAIASVVDMIIRSARAEYTQLVTGKLKRDGYRENSMPLTS